MDLGKPKFPFAVHVRQQLYNIKPIYIANFCMPAPPEDVRYCIISFYKIILCIDS